MNFEWPTDDKRRIRALQELRSPRVDTQVQPKEIDDWLKQSIALVAEHCSGGRECAWTWNESEESQILCF